MYWTHKILAVVLAAQLGWAPAARAQVPPFPVPPPAQVLLLPLLLLALPLGMELSKSDESRVRELEKAGDWTSIAAMAERHLADKPDDPHWRAVRGWSAQQAGRCVDALPDLRASFDRRIAMGGPLDKTSFESGLAFGLCQMVAWELDDATQTMSRLRAAAPERWEPLYNLGAIAALRGDRDAAGAAAATMQSVDRPRADALRAFASAVAAAHAAPEPADAAAPTPRVVSHPATTLEGTRLAIGHRALLLPKGDWALVAVTDQVAMASNVRHVFKANPVTLVSAHVRETAAAGRVGAALAFTANPQRARGLLYWDAENACKLPGTLHVERFRSSLDRPECLSVRVVDDRAMLPAVELRAPSEGGTVPPAPVYEIRYSRYDMEWMVASTWLLPMERVAGDLAAVQWARALAAQLRPLTGRRGVVTAVAPPLGP